MHLYPRIVCAGKTGAGSPVSYPTNHIRKKSKSLGLRASRAKRTTPESHQGYKKEKRDARPDGSGSSSLFVLCLHSLCAPRNLNLKLTHIGSLATRSATSCARCDQGRLRHHKFHEDICATSWPSQLTWYAGWSRPTRCKRTNPA